MLRNVLILVESKFNRFSILKIWTSLGQWLLESNGLSNVWNSIVNLSNR